MTFLGLTMICCVSCELFSSSNSDEMKSDDNSDINQNQGVILIQGNSYGGFCPTHDCEPTKTTGTFYLVDVSDSGGCDVLDSATQIADDLIQGPDTLFTSPQSKVCLKSVADVLCSQESVSGECEQIKGPCSFTDKSGIPEFLGDCFEVQEGEFSSYTSDVYHP